MPDLERRDERPIDLGKEEILCFSCVRNEALRLPYFLEYHRNLGVDRFFIIDNASEDATLEYLLTQEDVNVFSAAGSYAESKCGVTWLNQLLTRFGTGHWTLTLDADELLIYPFCEDIGLRQFTTFLNQVQSQGLVAFLLDMYADKAIRKSFYDQGTPFQDACPYFDSDSYHERDSDIPVRGGPRHRLFWAGREREKPSPFLRKIPLVYWRSGLEFLASTHTIKNLRLAPVTGALLHFKLFSDFYTSAEKETQRREHWDGAAQYESYWNVLRDARDLNAFYTGSLKYQNSSQLVELGLLKLSAEFKRFAGRSGPI